ncbi:MAG: hypothetical protein KGI78_02765 [Patescibacteria group bacterium]|nr:hypothetical protein [Patescibacteria group bacterium]MDE1943924.1 hypothetical protein [Patescibacteria group bacterium]MDE1944888.1 hypothetical protein [Patescibacteria group bacterium]MDE2057752.1 hypothetical protein [Patescibacteria group bacterium]
MSFAERLDRIREKPRHVRERVAFGIAGGVTAVIALAWLSISLYTGAFAIQGSSFAQLTGAEQPAAGDSGAGGAPQVAGAAAAAPADTAGPPALQVISPADPSASSSSPQSGQTIIPF